VSGTWPFMTKNCKKKFIVVKKNSIFIKRFLIFLVTKHQPFKLQKKPTALQRTFSASKHEISSEFFLESILAFL
jgi:hypothetical protein